MYEELLSRAKAIDNEATPGPWRWDLHLSSRQCMLETDHSGQYYVMGFSRWGMNGACPEFQQFERYSGPVDERGGMGMVRADKLAKSYPGKEHHVGFDDYINHPDAAFIAKSRALVPELIAAIETMAAQLACNGEEIERLNEQVEVDSQLKSGLSNANALCGMYKNDLARVTAERDAGVNLIKSRCYLEGGGICEQTGRPCDGCLSVWRTLTRQKRR